MKNYFLLGIIMAGLLLITFACSTDNTTANSTGNVTGLFPTANITQPAPSATSARPSPSDLVPRITIQDLYKEMQAKANILIVDARAGVETLYEADHIKGAIPVPLSKFTEGWSPSVPPDTEIVIYCT